MIFPSPFSVSQNTRVWIPPEFCRNCRTLVYLCGRHSALLTWQLYQAADVPFASTNGNGPRVCETGPDSWGYFWGTGCPGRQRWQSCQMSLFERHINTFCALVFSSLLLCKQTVFLLNRLPLLARSYWSSGWMPAEPGQQWAAHWHSLAFTVAASQPANVPTSTGFVYFRILTHL